MLYINDKAGFKIELEIKELAELIEININELMLRLKVMTAQEVYDLQSNSFNVIILHIKILLSSN